MSKTMSEKKPISQRKSKATLCGRLDEHVKISIDDIETQKYRVLTYTITDGRSANGGYHPCRYNISIETNQDDEEFNVDANDACRRLFAKIITRSRSVMIPYANAKYLGHSWAIKKPKLVRTNPSVAKTIQVKGTWALKVGDDDFRYVDVVFKLHITKEEWSKTQK